MIKETISAKIYTFLQDKNLKDLRSFDENNRITKDSDKIKKFTFCFVTEDGEDLGPVVIMLSKNEQEDPIINLNYDDELANLADDKDFLSFITFFKHELQIMGVKTVDFNHGELGREKSVRRELSMKPMFESQFGEMGGSIRTSIQPLEKLRIIIKHSDRVDPEARASRSRKIEKIYLANGLGERFLLPFCSLKAARAMARHVSNGGTPYDELGNVICSLVDELLELGKFCRKMKNAEFEDPKLHELVDTVKERFQEIKRILGSLNSQGGYAKKSSELLGADTDLDDTVPMGFEHFENIDESLKGAMPYVWRAHNKKNKNMPKEASEFSDWADGLDLGTDIKGVD